MATCWRRKRCLGISASLHIQTKTVPSQTKTKTQHGRGTSDRFQGVPSGQRRVLPGLHPGNQNRALQRLFCLVVPISTNNTQVITLHTHKQRLKLKRRQAEAINTFVSTPLALTSWSMLFCATVRGKPSKMYPFLSSLMASMRTSNTSSSAQNAQNTSEGPMSKCDCRYKTQHGTPTVHPAHQIL